MAELHAYSAFSDYGMDLGRTSYAQEAQSSAVNMTIRGTTFPEVVSYYASGHSFYFGGTGLELDSDTLLSGGTVTGFSEFDGPVGDFTRPVYTITGISVNGNDVGQMQSFADPMYGSILLSKAFIGNDRLFGSRESDTIAGYLGDDLIRGDAGNDWLDGGTGNDTVFGGAGDDYIATGFSDNDIIDGRSGHDVVVVESLAGVFLDLRLGTSRDRLGAVDTLSNIEGAEGSESADSLTGNAGDNFLYGNAGDDKLSGNRGNDRLLGGAGRDRMTGGQGADQFKLFEFTTVADRDLITDFRADQGDTILLSTLSFDALSGTRGSVLSKAQFHTTTGANAAHDADDRIIYNSVSGALYYDADGIGGVDAVQIARIGTALHPALTANDFLIAF